jgi:hypothetical protein
VILSPAKKTTSCARRVGAQLLAMAESGVSARGAVSSAREPGARHCGIWRRTFFPTARSRCPRRSGPHALRLGSHERGRDGGRRHPGAWGTRARWREVAVCARGFSDMRSSWRAFSRATAYLSFLRRRRFFCKSRWPMLLPPRSTRSRRLEYEEHVPLSQDDLTGFTTMSTTFW